MNFISCQHGVNIHSLLAVGLFCLLLPQAASATSCTYPTDSLGINEYHCNDDHRDTLRVDLLAQSKSPSSWHTDPLGNLRGTDGTVLRKDPAGNWRSSQGVIYRKDGIGPLKTPSTGSTWRKDPLGNIRGGDGTVCRLDTLQQLECN